MNLVLVIVGKKMGPQNCTGAWLSLITPSVLSVDGLRTLGLWHRIPSAPFGIGRRSCLIEPFRDPCHMVYIPTEKARTSAVFSSDYVGRACSTAS